jgi:hypothetical protein
VEPESEAGRQRGWEMTLPEYVPWAIDRNREWFDGRTDSI